MVPCLQKFPVMPWISWASTKKAPTGSSIISFYSFWYCPCTLFCWCSLGGFSVNPNFSFRFQKKCWKAWAWGSFSRKKKSKLSPFFYPIIVNPGQGKRRNHVRKRDDFFQKSKNSRHFSNVSFVHPGHQKSCQWCPNHIRKIPQNRNGERQHPNCVKQQSQNEIPNFIVCLSHLKFFFHFVDFSKQRYK